MRICLLSICPERAGEYLAGFRELHAADRSKQYELVASPEEAELTLITDLAVWGDHWWRLETFNAHPLVRAGRNDVFVYNELDSPFCVYQGLYCSMPKGGFNRWRQRAVPYYRFQNPYVLEMSGSRESVVPRWLLSFVGANNAPVRGRLLALRHSRGRIEDSSLFSIYSASVTLGIENDARMRGYVQGLLDTKFVVCPKGLGTSSVRLFETMALGRVPVIVSDDWVAPQGPDWAKCSLRVPERDVEMIPALLERVEGEWPSMAKAARAEWEQWFAPDVLFRRMIEACLDIQRENRMGERFWRSLPDRQQWVYRVGGALKNIWPRIRTWMGAGIAPDQEANEKSVAKSVRNIPTSKAGIEASKSVPVSATEGP